MGSQGAAASVPEMALWSRGGRFGAALLGHFVVPEQPAERNPDPTFCRQRDFSNFFESIKSVEFCGEFLTIIVKQALKLKLRIQYFHSPNGFFK